MTYHPNSQPVPKCKSCRALGGWDRGDGREAFMVGRIGERKEGDVQEWEREIQTGGSRLPGTWGEPRAGNKEQFPTRPSTSLLSLCVARGDGAGSTHVITLRWPLRILQSLLLLLLLKLHLAPNTVLSNCTVRARRGLHPVLRVWDILAGT